MKRMREKGGRRQRVSAEYNSVWKRFLLSLRHVADTAKAVTQTRTDWTDGRVYVYIVERRVRKSFDRSAAIF